MTQGPPSDAGSNPPPGGYGPPPPGAPGGYGPAPYSATDAIGYGWMKFRSDPWPMVLATLILLVVSGGIGALANLLGSALFLDEPTVTVDPDTGAFETSGGGGFLAGLLVSTLVAIVAGLLGQLLVAGLIRGALDSTDGRRTDLASMYQRWDKGKVLVAAILVAVATGIGTLLCYLPGLVVGYLASYTMFFVVDRDLPPVEAIKASVRFTTGHLGETLLFYVLGVLVVIAGAIVCGVGLLVALPIAVLGAAYTFRRLHGQEVAPPGQAPQVQ